MLENAVAPVKALRSVKDQSDQLKAHRLRDLTYDEYNALIMSAATNFDSKFKTPVKKSSRTVYEHDLYGDVDDDGDSDNYGIDLPLDVIQANFTKTAGNNKGSSIPPASFLPKDKWKDLTPEARDIWAMFPSDMKAVILRKEIKDRLENLKSPPKNSNNKIKKSFTKAMLHELLKDMSDSEDDDIDACNEQDNSAGAGSDSNDESTLLVNSTTCKNVSPADIRALMSTPKKDKTNETKNKNKKLSSNNTCTAPSDEINVNGKLYRSVNATMLYRSFNSTVTYSTSKIDMAINNSLVDRGANGGVCGEDVKIICYNPDRKVDVRGIDNHEISSIPLVSAGGVTTSLNGDLIVIMHQCAYCGKG